VPVPSRRCSPVLGEAPAFVEALPLQVRDEKDVAVLVMEKVGQEGQEKGVLPEEGEPPEACVLIRRAS
jgi:hypothetical protein